MTIERVLTATALFWCVCVRAAVAEQPASGDAKVRESLTKGLSLIAASAVAYEDQRECYSCHHQALPVMAISLAGKHGAAGEAWANASGSAADFTLDYFSSRREQMSEGKGVPGNSYSAGYALVSLADAGREADDTTDALVKFLLHKQEDIGRWKITAHRPPLEHSDFTATALAIRGLKHFARGEQKDRVSKSIDNGRRWLIDNVPTEHEDFVFRLLGLAWSDADAMRVREASDDIWLAQREDGGWAQLPEMESDAYATGQALTALRLAGNAKAADAEWQRGLTWLLKHQQADGSWRVETRAKPFQTYFESGFPHGKAQFISISGSCWAVMALALADEK